ncbi:MAG: serine/threonine-protein kinase [Planctomycetota bacterium]
MSDPRDPLDILATEFVDQIRQGDSPDIESIATANPELADEVRELFPILEEMERAKAEQPSTPVFQRQPERLGDLRILREIGRGGMGIVYEAEQLSLRRRVAVKILPSAIVHDERSLRRFRREARTAARLHHTNIVPIFGVGSEQSCHYYVMQLIDGVGLDRILRALPRAQFIRSRSEEDSANQPAGPMTPRDALAAALLGEGFPIVEQVPAGDDSGELSGPATQQEVTDSLSANDETTRTAVSPTSQLRNGNGKKVRKGRERTSSNAASLDEAYFQNVAKIGYQAACALEYAHGQGVLHRDVKPANLILDRQGVTWVADFGLAKSLAQETASRTGDLSGTLRYIPPERFSGEGDARSDVYSLGLALYELLAWRPGFDATDPAQLVSQITHSEPDELRTVNPAIPRDLATVVHKAMAREPKHRYATAGEFADDLRRYLQGNPVHARRLNALERSWRWMRKNPVITGLWFAVFASLFLVALVTTVGYVRTQLALKGARVQRERAENTVDLAIEALDRVYHDLAPSRTVDASRWTVDTEDGETREIAVEPAVSPQTVALLEGMLDFYRRLAATDPTDDRLAQKMAAANHRIGMIRARLGQYQESIKAYHSALSLYKKLLVETNQSPAVLLAAAEANNELGEVYAKNVEKGKSLAAHENAKKILTELRLREEVPEVVCELARSYYLMARVMNPEHPGSMGPPELPGSAQGRPPGHERGAFAREGKDRRPPRHDDPSFRREKHDDFRRRPPEKHGPPPSRDQEKKRAEAEAALQTAAKLLEDLGHKPERSAQGDLLLACIYREMARNALSEEQANAELQKAIDTLEEVQRRHPTFPDVRSELAKTYSQTPMPFPEDDEAWETFVKRMELAVELERQLVREYPDLPEYRLLLTRSLLRFSDGQSFLGKDRESIESLREAVSNQTELVARFPGTKIYACQHADLQTRLASRLMHFDPREAQRMAQSAKTELESLKDAGLERWLIDGPLRHAEHIIEESDHPPRHRPPPPPPPDDHFPPPESRDGPRRLGERGDR